MKKVYTLLSVILIFTAADAKTYTLHSGKWSDVTIWGGEYIGSTIKAEDEVIVTGQITLTTPLVVEGKLQVEKGGAMVGMKDLVVAKGGLFVNNGNTVMKRILNKGSIKNNRILEAIMDIENTSSIENNGLMNGNSFDNFGGNATGTDGVYYVNNSLNASPASKIGNDVKVYYGDAHDQPTTSAPAMNLDASVSTDGVVLKVVNPSKKDVSVFSVEKSEDGTNYSLMDMITNINKESEVAATYTDFNVTNLLTYYRVTAITLNGENMVLPIAAVKAAVSGYAMAR